MVQANTSFFIMFRRRFQRRSFRPSTAGNFVRFVSDAVAMRTHVADGAIYRQVIIQPSNVADIRRCKNFDLVFTSEAGNAFWALIYVPQGINPGATDITLIADAQPPISLYSPEQHIIASGVATLANTSHYFAKANRALSDGDQVVLLIRAEGALVLDWRCSFNIAFA
jgi:hypothetical protein